MHCVKKLQDDLYWVGGSDRRLALFENVFPIPRGVSYNAYVVLDEKTILLDTVDRSVSGLFFENLEHVLDGRPLDYLVVNHMEPDHCATMQELVLRHPDIRQYTTLWMDTLRDGQSSLVNTNKLVRFYPGCTGLKTGSTSTAGYCLSATAEKDGMELIAVILKGTTSAQRFEDAKTLLNHGFATYTLCPLSPAQALPPIPVTLGERQTVQPLAEEGKILLEKSQATDLEQSLDLPERLEAPVRQGDRLGTLTVKRQGETVAEVPILAAETVERVSWKALTLQLLRTALFAG